MTPLKCLVVDDESFGRKLVEDNIRQIPFLEWVGSAKNAFEAMALLQQTPIDLLFLDIQMPGMLGTQFLKSLPSRPMTIFVTAYSNYAVESYDLDVIDYLVKPVSFERFAKAAFKALEARRPSAPLPIPATTPIETAPPFFVHVEYALVKVVPCDITYVEGMKDYVKIFLKNAAKPILTKCTLKYIEEKLANDNAFLRIHKSFIVNLPQIESIRNREVKIGTSEIPVGEGYWDAFTQRLGLTK